MQNRISQLGNFYNSKDFFRILLAEKKEDIKSIKAFKVRKEILAEIDDEETIPLSPEEETKRMKIQKEMKEFLFQRFYTDDISRINPIDLDRALDQGPLLERF